MLKALGRARAASVPRRQRGITLIEVLVAVLISAIGLVALLAMQSTALRYQRASEARTTATMLVADIADRMRANRTAALAGEYDRAQNPYTPPSNPPDNADCPAACASGADLAAMDMARWLTTVFYALPGGEAQIAKASGNANARDVWILWVEPVGVTSTGRDDSGLVSDDECPNIGTAYNADNQRPRCLYFQVQL